MSALVYAPLAAIVAISLLSPYAGLVLCCYVVAILASLTASALSGEPRHIRAALTMPLYWPLASVAAYRALLDLLFQPLE